MVGKNENSSAFARLKGKLGWLFLPYRLQMAEAALALSEQKAQGLGELLATAEQEQRSLAQRQAKEHRLEQQVGRRAGGQTVLGGVTSGAHALSHPQEAAERESKLLRDLSAANEKHLLLRNQVGGGGGVPGPGVGAGAGAGAKTSRPWCWLPRWTSWSGR